MVKISAKAKKELKKPLGKTYKSYERIVKLSKDHKVVAIGDICALALLSMGIRPFVAVFDYKVMRKPVNKVQKTILSREFKKAKKYKNPAGTVSDKLLKDAKTIMKKGGAVRIQGEEDLTALVFIKHAGKNTIIVYGQPHEGLVLVKPTNALKKKVEKML